MNEMNPNKRWRNEPIGFAALTANLRNHVTLWHSSA